MQSTLKHQKSENMQGSYGYEHAKENMPYKKLSVENYQHVRCIITIHNK